MPNGRLSRQRHINTKLKTLLAFIPVKNHAVLCGRKQRKQALEA